MALGAGSVEPDDLDALALGVEGDAADRAELEQHYGQQRLRVEDET